MAYTNDPHTLDLVNQLRALKKEMLAWKGPKNIDIIIEIIRKQPGWTTIAEIAFTNTLAESLRRQINSINETSAGFVDAARKVKPVRKNKELKEKKGVLKVQTYWFELIKKQKPGKKCLAFVLLFYFENYFFIIFCVILILLLPVTFTA